MQFPCVRPLAIVTATHLGDEIVAFVEMSDGKKQFHSFSESAFVFWQKADGTHSVAELAELVFGDRSAESLELAEIAVEQLGAAGLLEGIDPERSSLLSRRRAVKMAAAGILGTVGLPLVKSITAPDAVSADTCIPGVTGTIPDTQNCTYVGSAGCLSCCCCGYSITSSISTCIADPSNCKGDVRCL